MALALGLGSLFNHVECPNVSFSHDPKTESIRYATTRDVTAGEELCISDGFKLWLSPVEKAGVSENADTSEADAGYGGLTAVVDEDRTEIPNPYEYGDQEEIIPEQDLPFTRFKPPPEEEDAESIKTVDAWVVDVPEARHITTLLKWLKQAGLEGPELGHLKRVRRRGENMSLLLSTTSEPPQLPQDLNLPAPYLIPVPVSSALTLPSLSLKSALWPTMYTPRRKDEPEPWTRGKTRWAWNAMKRAADMAIKAQSKFEELPVAAHIPAPYGAPDDKPSSSAFIASDSRHSTQHPLRHAAINAIRKMADYRAESEDPGSGPPMTADASSDEATQSSANYLLTDRTFFITHEPCIMCSMALLHSRVKEVFFLYSMGKTGGCGGCACLPTLKGVNHRFAILQWKGEASCGGFSKQDIEIDAAIDV
ncbi:hypothetical protein GALMADRAFT_88274 [Galerina marginata CBS 339.88]|uniref:CMP/dCMP-type deaminase domain-containing protein n=1 Tax=Galerina marginata (strain CBS 339.88) TaxID=685588 RepID=A0A067TUP6_GALM3|nr:hypothetical protein GALMADRAFT_88274 [Galerina marginata CBS 339.88]